jgi:hypothetical protein
LGREPFCEPAAQLLGQVERGKITGYLSAHMVPHMMHLVGKMIGGDKARKEIQHFLFLLEVAPVSRGVLEAAFRSKVRDYEDAVVDEAARAVQADVIASRNTADFKSASTPVAEPQQLLATLKSAK